MTVVLTIRDVPDDVRERLAAEARLRGQSLQAYLLGVLRRDAAFASNRGLVVELAGDVEHGGVDETAPDAADLLAAARATRARSAPGSP